MEKVIMQWILFRAKLDFIDFVDYVTGVNNFTFFHHVKNIFFQLQTTHVVHDYITHSMVSQHFDRVVIFFIS